jgi:signal transduction histidine kinase
VALLLDGFGAAARLRSVHSLAEQEVVVVRADRSELAVAVTGRYRRDEKGRIVGVTVGMRELRRRAHQAPSGIEIVSVVSHELRSPLTSLKGYTGVLLSRWDRLNDAQKRDLLEQINHDADRVRRLIDELLDISRLETGRLVLRRQMVSLEELAARVIDKLRFEWPEVDVAVEVAADVPDVYADSDKLTQVLTNLLENACKYAAPQGIMLSAMIDGLDVAVEVRDRGEGIPPEDLPKVFTKFFRRDLGRPSGLGLGLWISRGLVEAHGGRLTAASIPGSGSAFRFTLPLNAFEELHGS